VFIRVFFRLTGRRIKNGTAFWIIVDSSKTLGHNDKLLARDVVLLNSLPDNNLGDTLNC
jgi:hypothetical protein